MSKGANDVAARAAAPLPGRRSQRHDPRDRARWQRRRRRGPRGSGDDQLYGGADNDSLILMADTFVLTAVSGGTCITDFKKALDKIQLSGFTPDALGCGPRSCLGQR
jgi:hypothetical protein